MIKSQYDQHLFRLGIADCVKTADRSSHFILLGYQAVEVAGVLVTAGLISTF